MNKDLNYYLLYIEDIKADLAITLRRKLWKHSGKIFASIQVLIETLEDVTKEALASEILDMNDKVELQKEVIDLLKQFELSKEALKNLLHLQLHLTPLKCCSYRTLKDW